MKTQPLNNEELAGRVERLKAPPNGSDNFALAKHLLEITEPPASEAQYASGARQPSAGSGRPLTPLQKLVAFLSVEMLRAAPPRREYLLAVASTGIGVLVQGRVGLIAARGGTGKTMVFVSLAVAVALGLVWFGQFGWQATQGRVMLALAEEDTAEVLRRLHAAAAGLNDEQLARLVENITVLPLAGHGVALTTEVDHATGELPETPRAEEFREILRTAAQEGRPYSLVILDPLSRFAGTDVEKDNAAATRFVQTTETFTSLECGAPSVLIAHHVKKSSKDDDKESADPIRGASALVDAVRFAITIDQQKRIVDAPDLLKLRVVKSNYAPTPEPLMLCRPADGAGILRVAEPGEVSDYQARAVVTRSTIPREERVSGLTLRILEELSKTPGTGSSLATRVRARKELVGDACRRLELDGEIVRVDGPHSAWTLTTERSGNGSGRGPSATVPDGSGSRPPFRGGTREPSLLNGSGREAPG